MGRAVGRSFLLLRGGVVFVLRVLRVWEGREGLEATIFKRIECGFAYLWKVALWQRERCFWLWISWYEGL